MSRVGRWHVLFLNKPGDVMGHICDLHRILNVGARCETCDLDCSDGCRHIRLEVCGCAVPTDCTFYRQHPEDLDP